MKLFWYDGGKRPDEADMLDRKKMRQASGCLVVGDKGKLYAPGRLLRAGTDTCWAASAMPQVNLAEVAGPFRGVGPRHQGGQAGHVQLRHLLRRPDRDDPAGQPGGLGRGLGQGREIEWDAKNLRSPNVPGLEPIIKPHYRPGYTLDV